MRKTIKEVSEDPKKFAIAEAKESAWTLVIVPYCFALFFIILFFLAGYVFGDGSGFFRVLFWIFFIPFLIISYVFYNVRKALLRVLKKRTPTDGPDVVHVEVREIKPENLVE